MRLLKRVRDREGQELTMCRSGSRAFQGHDFDYQDDGAFREDLRLVSIPLGFAVLD